MPTGAGKSLVVFLYALCIRRQKPKALVVVGQPLSALIAEQHRNPLGVPVLALSMGGNLRGSLGQVSTSPPSEDVLLDAACSGAYAVFFGHPEAFDSKLGQEILQRLAQEDLICAVLVDEVHQGMQGHWDKIRPGMIRKVLNVRVHASPESPLACFTATITEEEVQTIQGLVGKSRQLRVIGDGPIMSHHKLVMVRRPSSQVEFLGSASAPGLLQLLRVLLLDRLVRDVRGGRPYGNFKKAIIFFRSAGMMGEVNSCHQW